VILSTVSSFPHTVEEVESLATMGFDYICVRTGGFKKYAEDKEWSAGIEVARDLGIKVLLTWPWYSEFAFTERDGLIISDPHYSCKAFDGRTNTPSWHEGVGNHCPQFSLWNDEVEEALVADMGCWLEEGPEVDGVHIAVSDSDRNYPTNWWAHGDKAIEGTRMFWSFDEAAQVKWDEYSGGAPMPSWSSPVITPDGEIHPELLRFYRWYQDGWIGRITRLADTALDAGLKHISTWWLPHNQWTEINMANGSADSVAAISSWCQHVDDRGGTSMPMVAFQYGLAPQWPIWYADGMETIPVACAEPYNIRLLVGAEADVSGDITADTIRKHGRLTAEMGASGLLCGVRLWLGTPFEAEVAEALATIRPLFARNANGETA